MTDRRRGLRERRGAAWIVVVGVLAVGLIVVFSSALTRSTDLEAEAEVARAEVAALQERVLAGMEEIEFIETETFIRQQARAIGLGTSDEQPFSLPEDAPSPPPIVPLGVDATGAGDATPLQAWMALLFGA